MAHIVIEDVTPPVREYRKEQIKSILGGVVEPLGILSPFDMDDGFALMVFHEFMT